MSEFFGRAVPFAWRLPLGVSFRAISLRGKLTTNGELSSPFTRETHAPSRAQFGVPPNARRQPLRAKRVRSRTGLCAGLSFRFVTPPPLVSVNIHQSNDRAVDPVVGCAIRAYPQ